MKALILAGGAGTRLRPITHTRAKQLVPVANKPILFYGLEAIADAGIKEVGIVVGDTAAEVRAAVGDGSAWGLTVTYIPQDAPLGLAHCVLIARDFLGDDDFVMYLGDNLLKQSLKDFVDRFEADRLRATSPDARRRRPAARPCAQILLKPVPDPHRFGVAELDADGSVVRLRREAGRPAVRPGPGRRVPLRRRGSTRRWRPSRPSARGELEITDAIQWLIDQGLRVRTEILDGWWIDTGKLTPLLEANRLILETLERRIDGEVDERVARSTAGWWSRPGARIVRSRIRGPVDHRRRHHGRPTASSGPFTAIGRRCVIERQRDRALGDPRRLPGARRRPARGLPARPSRRGDPHATAGPGPPG